MVKEDIRVNAIMTIALLLAQSHAAHAMAQKLIYEHDRKRAPCNPSNCGFVGYLIKEHLAKRDRLMNEANAASLIWFGHPADRLL